MMTDIGLTGRPRVMIADDDALVLYTVKRILEEHAEIVGEAMDGPTAVEMAEQLHPDVLLLDLSMPVFGGMEAMRRIRESAPQIRIIIVTSHSDRAYVDEAFKRGAQGFVFKGPAMVQLPRAIEDVMKDQIFRPA